LIINKLTRNLEAVISVIVSITSFFYKYQLFPTDGRAKALNKAFQNYLGLKFLLPTSRRFMVVLGSKRVNL
jgi:hypothetical protein